MFGLGRWLGRRGRSINVDDPNWPQQLLARFLEESHRAVEDIAPTIHPEFRQTVADDCQHADTLRSLVVFHDWEPEAAPVFSRIRILPADKRAVLLFEAVSLRERTREAYLDNEGLQEQDRDPAKQRASRENRMLGKLLDRLLADGADLGAEHLAMLIARFDVGDDILPIGPVLDLVEDHAARHGLPQQIREALVALVFRPGYWGFVGRHDRATPVQRILWVLAGRIAEDERATFEAAPQAVAMLADGGDEEAWKGYLALFESTERRRPTKRWLRKIDAAIERIGIQAFSERMADVLNAWALGEEPRELVFIDLKHLFWSVGQVADPVLSTALGAVVARCYREDPSYLSLGALDSLSRQGSMDAVIVLARLRRTFRKPECLQRTERELKSLAERMGLSENDLDEVCVPAFGLSAKGELRLTAGPFEAVVTLVEGAKAEVRWLRAGSTREQKSVPAEVKRGHERDLRRIRATARDIRDELRNQRRRLEGILAADREWEFPVWRERYLEHPLIAPMARGLIWRVEDGDRTTTVIWPDGAPIQADDRSPSWIGDRAIVRLWHPVDAHPGEVAAWREWMLRRGFRQPFKQAFRESYTLTPAELETETYSNRFAGHFVREAQFAAVGRSRHWWAPRLGGFDAGGLPAKVFRETRIRVEFWVEAVEDPALQTDSGLYLFGATDRVDFARFGERDSLPIDQVPPRVFSEAMRDVDLFVSVSSIGADPTWEDRGDHPEMSGYWSDYVDTALDAGDEMRRDVLAAILPRLKIAERCTLEDRHLFVRGNRLRYRINLRSGAVFAEPSGHHLCILADGKPRGGYERLLPFDDDTILSAILAKAFLLAADDKIEDPSIKSQIDAAAR